MAVGTASGLLFSRFSLRNLDQPLTSAKALILLTHLRHLLSGHAWLEARSPDPYSRWHSRRADPWHNSSLHISFPARSSQPRPSSSNSVFPECSRPCGSSRRSRIVPDPVDQNGAAFRIFSHHDILYIFLYAAGKVRKRQKPRDDFRHHRAYVRYLYFVFFGSDFVLKRCLKASILHMSCINISKMLK